MPGSGKLQAAFGDKVIEQLGPQAVHWAHSPAVVEGTAVMSMCAHLRLTNRDKKRAAVAARATTRRHWPYQQNWCSNPLGTRPTGVVASCITLRSPAVIASAKSSSAKKSAGVTAQCHDAGTRGVATSIMARGL